MESKLENAKANEQSKVGGPLKKWLLASLYVVSLFSISISSIPFIWKGLYGLLIVLCLASVFFDQPPTINFLMKLFGRFRHIQVSDPLLEQRVRLRYQPQIGELTSLGFNFLFFEGSSFSLFRLVFVFPALVFLTMWKKGEVITLHDGTELLSVNPIFASADKSSYGHPNGLGIMFHTVFQDGSIMVSLNYGDEYTTVSPTGSRSVRHVYKSASIAETWLAHRQGIQSQEQAGNRVATAIGFDAYVEIIRERKIV